jgi:hypothetical protein
MTSNSQLALTNSWEFVAVLDLGLGFNVRIRIRMTSSGFLASLCRKVG